MKNIGLYIKQAWLVIKQNRLFSGIYITGTGLSIAMIMALFIILSVKFSPMYPEYKRERILSLDYVKVETRDTVDSNWWQNMCSYGLAEMIKELPSAENVTAIRAEYTRKNEISTELNTVNVHLLYSDADYWKVYDFEFVNGRGYTESDVAAKSHKAVMSQSCAMTLFASDDVAGRKFDVGGVEYEVSGVVRDVASSMSKYATADVWLPISCSEYYGYMVSSNEMMGMCSILMTAKSADRVQSLQREIKEMMHKYNQNDPQYITTLLGPDEHWKSQFRYGESMQSQKGVKQYCYILFALLFIPALNLSGMISSKMNKRLGELGIRKAYGATRWQLLSQVIWENLVLTMLGGLLGILLAYVVVMLSSDWIINLLNMGSNTKVGLLSNDLSLEMLLDWKALSLTVLSCLVLNLVSAIVPAAMSLRHSIINSLNSKQ